MLILLSISWGMGAHHIWQLKDILHKSGRAIWIKAMAVGCFVNCGTMEGERKREKKYINNIKIGSRVYSLCLAD